MGTLLFVHGFANDFNFALLSTAQLAVDLKFKGSLAMFSWPSRGDPYSYIADRSSTDDSIAPSEKFFKLVRASATKLYVVAHSMGAYLTLRTVDVLPEDFKIDRCDVGAQADV